jgi:hypothetical protein
MDVLTVLNIILVNDQFDAQLLFLCVYFNSLHVSNNLVLIIRRINCSNTSGMCPSTLRITSMDLLTALNIILVNDQLDAQLLFLYVYFNSLHVSNNLVLIIRRISCINTTSGMCPNPLRIASMDVLALLNIILVNDQLDKQFFFFLYVYFNSLHVSSNLVLIAASVV